jgi:hypothetical protein
MIQSITQGQNSVKSKIYSLPTDDYKTERFKY